MNGEHQPSVEKEKAVADLAEGKIEKKENGKTKQVGLKRWEVRMKKGSGKEQIDQGVGEKIIRAAQLPQMEALHPLDQESQPDRRSQDEDGTKKPGGQNGRNPENHPEKVNQADKDRSVISDPPEKCRPVKSHALLFDHAPTEGVNHAFADASLSPGIIPGPTESDGPDGQPSQNGQAQARGG